MISYVLPKPHPDNVKLVTEAVRWRTEVGCQDLGAVLRSRQVEALIATLGAFLAAVGEEHGRLLARLEWLEKHATLDPSE